MGQLSSAFRAALAAAKAAGEEIADSDEAAGPEHVLGSLALSLVYTGLVFGVSREGAMEAFATSWDLAVKDPVVKEYVALARGSIQADRAKRT